jgi:ubiquinone/menaquinone biosynthesis C-methylase UbiE
MLDAGCGIGRYSVFFAEQGIKVSGIDISAEAVEVAKAWLHKKSLHADLAVGDVSNLQFDNETFDLVVTDGVLDHVPMKDAKKMIQEIWRVLKPSGYLFITLRSIDDCEFTRGEKFEHNSYILPTGYEKGIIQHYFDINEIQELLQGFKVFDIELEEHRFPREFTEDKAFIQSSKGQKTYLDIKQPLDLNLKYSRWFIAAEKK